VTIGRPIKHIDANDKAANEWLNAFKKSTRTVYRGHWHRITKFTGMTGDEMLADRRNDNTGKWEKKLLTLKQWMKKQGWGDYTARQATIALRSFFAFHRVELKVTHQESSKLRQARRKTEDYKFTVEDLSRMDAVGNIEEKYIVTAGKSYGLRAGDFLRLTRGHFDAIDLEQQPPIALGEYATQKEAVSAFPFIDSDAILAVKALLAKMDRQGRTDANERMIKYAFSSELTRVLQRLVTEAGIETGNKVVRFHGLRKFLIDRLSDVMSESKWKQIVGKTISEGAYVSAERLREDYERAMQETTYKKMATKENLKLMVQKETLINFAKAQGLTDSELKKIFRSKKAVTTKEQVKALEQWRDRQTNNAKQQQTKPKCEDGNCQRIVSEAELDSLLTQGWRVAAVLPSGKIVVSNEH